MTPGTGRGRRGEPGKGPGAGRAHGVEDDQHLGGFMDHHDGGQAEDTERGQRDQRADDPQGDPDVLNRDSPGVAGVSEGLGQVAQFLTHEGDVGGLDRDVGTTTSRFG
ncbi:hypothetical protein I4I78_24055 [Pseudonocardia sp. KRD-291]|nr:hypothetical protein [Pseudonocardia sp. KRD291]